MSETLGDKRAAATANRLLLWLSRHWLLVFNLVLGLYVILPWIAPVLMELGRVRAAQAIYLFYAPQCHQLPQRSFFLFGEKAMHSLAEVQAAWQNTNNPLILRQFIGNPAMGWKVAWSDRMVSMYSSIPLFGLSYGLVRRQLKPLRLKRFILLLLPMVLDGGTHMVSDLTAGIGGGFRDSNAWLAALTGHALPATFYAGDALGSFNSWLRLLTGALMGLGIVWFVYPHLQQMFGDTGRNIEAQLLPDPEVSRI